MNNLKINSEYIRLCDAMKLANIVYSGGMAKVLILDEKVKVNNEICTLKGKKLYENDVFTFEGVDFKITK